MFVCFLNIPGKQQHFNLTYRKLVYCFYGESFFLDKINLKTVPKPFIFLRYRRHFAAKGGDCIHKYLHIYKQPTEYISKRAFQLAGGDLFS